MIIPKEELIKLATRGFALLKDKEEATRLRGYYAVCFVFGSTKTDAFLTFAQTASTAADIKNEENRLLNSIND